MKKLFDVTKPTVGVVIPLFWSGQFSPSLKGFIGAAEKYGFNLLCFQGTYAINCYSNSGEIFIENSGEIIFDILKDIHIDGMVLHTGSLRSYFHKVKLIEICRTKLSVPLVNIGTSIRGITNIQVGNECGMRALLEHLILQHKYTRFGFVRGPMESNDAEKRFDTYTKVMNEYGIPINQKLIAHSDKWSFEFGKIGTRQILENSNKQVEVIICASDLLATGAIDELNVLGIKVPEEIGVVGFNDNNFAEICFPPLTTVSQKLYERSWKAIEVLKDCISGLSLPDDIEVPSTPVIRRSCGCQYVGVQSIQNSCFKENSIPTDCSQLPTIHEQIMELIYSEIQISESILPKTEIAMLIDNFYKQCKNPSNSDFMYQFSELLNLTVSLKDTYKFWHSVLNVLEKRLHEYCSEEYLPQAIHCILQARIIVSDVAKQEYQVRLTKIEEYTSKMNFLNYGFNKVRDLQDIIKFMDTELSKIGITSCYLSLYTDLLKPLDSSRCIFAYNKYGKIPFPIDGAIFPTNELIPDSITIKNESVMMVIEPLFYGKNQLGFMILELDDLNNTFYSLFPSQLSAALWSAMLFSKEQKTQMALKEQADKLELTNSELKEWTNQLEKALLQLQENHERLLSSEKMASLGRFTAGITHEINTPLATLRASLEEMKRLTLEYRSSIDDKTVTENDHKEIVKDYFNSLALASTAIEKVSDFIVSIKAQTRDVKGEERHLFDLHDIINGVIVFLGFSLKRSSCKVSIRSTEKQFKIYGSPTRMTQIFTNLISNSIDAMEAGGEISIMLSDISDEITQVTVSDNGCGIPEEHMSQIFQPMFTTKPFGMGTGLGLSIVHDIIENDFGGTIHVKSIIKTGTTFTMEINNRLKEYKDNGKKI